MDSAIIAVVLGGVKPLTSRPSMNGFLGISDKKKIGLTNVGSIRENGKKSIIPDSVCCGCLLEHWTKSNGINICPVHVKVATSRTCFCCSPSHRLPTPVYCLCSLVHKFSNQSPIFPRFAVFCVTLLTY